MGATHLRSLMQDQARNDAMFVSNGQIAWGSEQVQNSLS